MNKNIKKIAVIGAGTMGHGIAQSFAQAGYPVSMMSRTQKTLDRAMTLIQSSLSAMAEGGILDQKSIPSIISSKITPTTSIEEAAQDADIAFETMAEDKEAKKEVFAQLDKYCPPRTLLELMVCVAPNFLATSKRSELISTAIMVVQPQYDRSQLGILEGVIYRMLPSL